MTTDIESRINEIIFTQLFFGRFDKRGFVSPSHIKPWHNLISDLAADSLDVMELVISLESEFKIEIDVDSAEVVGWEAVGDIYNYIRRLT